MSYREEVGEGGARVRRYERSDRGEVRRIALETVDRGNPIGGLRGMEEPLADLLTRYYTDYEAESAWVGESGGRVVGYALGAASTRRYRAIMACCVGPAAGLRGIARGGLWKVEAWRVAWVAARLAISSLDMPRGSLRAYPAHLHVGIEAGHRGRGLGKRLVERIEEQLGGSGIGGVHVRVRADNEGGRRFFERLGYQLIWESGAVRVRYPEGEAGDYGIAAYGKKIAVTV